MSNHTITDQEIKMINEYLRSNRITQSCLAERIGVNPITFSRWMTGTINTMRSFNWDMLLKEIDEDYDNAQPTVDDGLTEAERRVSDALVEAWNEYVELPSQHRDDIEEFRHSLHRLQHLLMARVVRREHAAWTNEDK